MALREDAKIVLVLLRKEKSIYALNGLLNKKCVYISLILPIKRKKGSPNDNIGYM